MRDPLIAPAEAYAPDADRAGPDVPEHLPEWLVLCLARLILLVLEFLLAACPRRSARQPAWWHDRPDLPAGSAQAEAASIRGSFGTAIAWMCRRRGIGPGHADWPELSRAIMAFGGSVRGFRAGAPPCGLQWWENPNIVPGMCGPTAATPAATAIALLLARQAVASTPSPTPNAMAAEAGHARLPAAWSCAARLSAARLPAACLAASWRQALVRLGTGPPTGPPAAWANRPGLPTLSRLTNGARAWPAPLS